MKKLLKNPTMKEHVIPTLIVGGWFLIIIAISLITK
tara:strand:- start:484 stop:591 length:108 start_codon:yes stop_codon:yes gene_type:complete